MDYFKMRMFLSEKQAFRLGVDLAMASEKSTINNGTNKPESTLKNSYFVFGLHPGIEMHYKGTDRLSPYSGAEIGFVMKSSKGSCDNLNGNANDKKETKKVWTDGTNQAFSSLGLNLFTGFDYYVLKSLYLGAEIGFGFATVTDAETTVTTTAGNTTTEVKTPKSSGMNLGFNYNAAIRLGWKIN
jgi:hypothetical protein